MNLEVLSKAVKDVRYLLNRGYPRASTVNFVSNHFRLDEFERHFLVRCVFSQSEARSHKKKLVGIQAVRGKFLGVDGYNVLITLESLAKGDFVVKCDDGILRDLRGVFGKYKFSRQTVSAVESLVLLLKRARPRAVAVLFDKQVSKSGELAGIVRKELRKASSSDRVIVERAGKVWDIAGDFARISRAKVFNLQKVK